VCFLALYIDPSREQNPATEEDWATSNKRRKTQSRIGKHGSLRMPIRSLVNSRITAEKGPTAIAVVRRHSLCDWCLLAAMADTACSETKDAYWSFTSGSSANRRAPG
jgi:hypothetical protein